MLDTEELMLSDVERPVSVLQLTVGWLRRWWKRTSLPKTSWQ